MNSFFIVLTLLFSLSFAFAEKDHKDHDHENAESQEYDTADEGHEEHDDHGDEKHKGGHGEHEEEGEEDGHINNHDHGKNKEGHDEHEEENSSIGSDKGILEKGEMGFRLAETAIKNFGLKYQRIDSPVFIINEAAIVKVLDKKFLFLERDGWYKKVPIKIQGHSGSNYSVVVRDIAANARAVVAGVGFLRTAELVVEEGVAHGHSH